VRSALDVLREVVARASEHRIGGEAAHVAYFGFLALLSTVPLLLALAATLGEQRASDGFVALLADALPGVAAASLERFVGNVRATRPALISVGAVVLLWSASNAVSALTLALNVTFGAPRPRAWWRRRLLVLLVAAAGTALLAIGSVIEVVGPAVLRELGLVRLSLAWRPLRSLVAFAILTGAVHLLYRVLPNLDRPRPWRPLLAGAMAGTAIWMAATLVFRLTLGLVGGAGNFYGTATGAIAIQVWVFITAFGLLIGAEVAAALERRTESPVAAAGRR
jgi:membrane protein